MSALQRASSRSPYNGDTVFVDRAIVTLDVNADLTSVFNWNVKQVFAFVAAEVTTSNGAKHTVTLWDSIIQSSAAAHISLSGVRTDYEWIDDWRTIRDSNITLALYYDTMPWVGSLHLSAAHSGSFKMPAKHCHRKGQCALSTDGAITLAKQPEQSLPIEWRDLDAPSSAALPLRLRKWF